MGVRMPRLAQPIGDKKQLLHYLWGAFSRVLAWIANVPGVKSQCRS